MKNILYTLIALFIGVIGFSQTTPGGITVNTNFQPNISAPIDARLYLSSLADTSTVAFPASDQLVYVDDVEEYWKYSVANSRWEKVVISSAALLSDTSSTTVYAPAHGYTLASFTGDVIAVKDNYDLANATNIDSTQRFYVVDIPHPDSLTLKQSGEITRTAHGLTVASTYFLQDTPNSTYGLTQGTVRSPAFFVLDANTLLLLEQGVSQKTVIPRRVIPASVITSFGGEPFNPNDTIIQNIAEVFQNANLIVAPSLLVTQSSGSSRNDVHQASTSLPSTPMQAWFWDGELVTRISYGNVSISARDTVYGTLFNLPLDTVALIGGVPTDSTIADWLETNYTSNGLSLRNGDMIHWDADGDKVNPDYIWMIIDDLNTIGIAGDDWDKIIKRVKDGAGGGPSAFTDLTDSPSSYSGQANKMVLVNPTENGLIFADTADLGSDGNMAESNLTADDDRSHDFANFDLLFTNIDSLSFGVSKRIDLTQGGQRFLHQTGGGTGGGSFENFFMGYQAGQNFNPDSTGYANTIIGRRAAQFLNGDGSLSSSNVAFGYDALRYNVTGSFNSAFGTLAGNGVSGQSHTRGTFLGYHTGRLNTADDVTLVGAFAGENNTATGSTYLGYRAGQTATSQTKNTYVGYFSGQATTGESNTYVGYEAGGVGVGIGGFNTVVGTEAGRSLSTGNTNLLAGRRAGYILSSGGNNVALGNNAGLTTLTTGSGNILIGYGKELSAAGVNNEMNIGDLLKAENINGSSGRLGINAFPDDESVFDLSSNTNSMIFPVGSYAQRPTISPKRGMVRYDTDAEGLTVYDITSGFWTFVSKIQFIDTVKAVTTLDQNKEYVVFDCVDGAIIQSMPSAVERWKWSFSCINCATNTATITTSPGNKLWYQGDTINSITIREGEKIEATGDGEYYYVTKSGSLGGFYDIANNGGSIPSGMEGVLADSMILSSGFLSLESSSDANLLTIRRPGLSGEYIRYKGDFGSGGGIQLVYEADGTSVFTQRIALDMTGTDLRLGSGFTNMFIDAPLETAVGDNTEEIILKNTTTDKLLTLPIGSSELKGDTALYLQNTNYTITTDDVEKFNLITFTSRVNSSSTEDNTITLPDPADSLVNTRIVVVSDDLDNSFTDSYDTEVAAANIYKGNQNIPTSYVLAGGESIELICVPRSTGYIWELVSTWDGWTSTSSFSNTSQTILTERKTFLIFNQAGGSNARDTLDVSDLEPGDQINVEILGAAWNSTKALYLTSGQFIWGSNTVDSLLFDYGDQQLDMTWNGTNMIVKGDVNWAGMVGHAQYTNYDTVTRASPQTITVGDTILMNFVPNDSLTSRIPKNVETFYSSADTAIVVPEAGDAFEIRLDYDIRSSTTDNYGIILIDIGTEGLPNIIVERTLSLPRGTGVWTRQSIGFLFYGETAFFNNKGKIKFYAPDDAYDIANFNLVIKRDIPNSRYR